MTTQETKDILSKQIVQLNMLITAAKQRGDLVTALQLEQELITAQNAFNAS